MPVWTPTKNVIDISPIAENLLAYITTNDNDALTWAGLTDAAFEATYTNASGRLQTIFPSLMVLSQTMETDLSGDILIAGLQMTLEGTVSGPDANQLVSDTKKFANAVESMLANIPSATLTANCTPATQASLFEIETRLDIVRGQAASSAFLQIFQTRCVYQLTAAAF